MSLKQLGILIILVWIFFSYRWIFHYHFDATYFKDWYDHSQWQIPLSPRIMGDSELYQTSAYSIVTGGSPFQMNPETPPLVKYMYGLAILWTRNPYYVSMIFYFLTLVGFVLLSRLLFSKKPFPMWIAFLLFLLSPLFFSQIGQIGLDLPQLCFLLFHMVLLFLALQKKKNQLTFFLLSGLLLGAFAGTKIGFFLPMIVLVDGWLLWRTKQLKWLAVLLMLTVLGYALTYTPYFLQHPSLIEWLKNQKWIVEFYTSSHFHYLPGMVFPSLLTGFFIHWTNGLTYIKEWTLIWPVSVVIVGLAALQQIRDYKKIFSREAIKGADFFWQYILLLTAGLIAMNTIIPFWPRYLMLVLPFLLLFTTQFLVQHRKFLVIALVAIGLQFLWYSFPQPQEMVSISTAAWQNYSYAEVYNFTSQQTQQNISRQNFVRTLQLVQIKLEDPKISISTQTPLTLPWQNVILVPATVTYQTILGNLTVSTNLRLVRQSNQWRIDWQWQNVLPNFDSYSQVVMTKEISQGGKLFTKDHILLSQGGSWPFISVIPDKAGDSEQLNTVLTSLTAAQGPALRVSLFVTHPGDLPVPVGFAQPFSEPEKLQKLSQDPSILIDQRWTRVYDSSVRQSPSLNLVQDQERLHPELLGQLGGQIMITQPSGQKVTIWQKEMKESLDVVLPQSFEELFGRKRE